MIPSLRIILVNGYVDRDKANVLLSGNVTLTNGIFRHYKMNMGNLIFRDKLFAELPTQQKLMQYPKILENQVTLVNPKVKNLNMILGTDATERQVYWKRND